MVLESTGQTLKDWTQGDSLIDEAGHQSATRTNAFSTRRCRANSFLSPKAAPTDTQSAVCPRSATMSHDKAKVIHDRTGRQMPNPSLRGPSKKSEPLSDLEPSPKMIFHPESPADIFHLCALQRSVTKVSHSSTTETLALHPGRDRAGKLRSS